MKKLFIYGVTALAMLTSCNDLLDKSPLDTFTNTPTYWIKKKISEALSVYFPATFNDVHEKDATERIIRRTRLVLSEITTEQDASEDIGRIDDFILMQNPPQ